MDMTADTAADRIRAALDRAERLNWRPDEIARLAARRVGRDVETVIDAVTAERAGTGAPAAVRDFPVAAWAQAVLLVTQLPPLPSASPVHGRARATGDTGRVLSRVRALLAKAESTTFPEEAEALTAKAQELIARHSIDEAMLNHDRSHNGPVTCLRVWIDDPYANAKSLLLGNVAAANRCTVVWNDALHLATVFGEPTDLDFVDVLFTSLLVQATSGVMAEGRRVDAVGRSRTRSFRQAFLVSFAVRVGERLASATRIAEEEGAARHGDSLLPVLASRREASREMARLAYPDATKARKVSATNYAGWVAGRDAADHADLAGGRLPRAAGQ